MLDLPESQGSKGWLSCAQVCTLLWCCLGSQCSSHLCCHQRWSAHGGAEGQAETGLGQTKCRSAEVFSSGQVHVPIMFLMVVNGVFFITTTITLYRWVMCIKHNFYSCLKVQCDHPECPGLKTKADKSATFCHNKKKVQPGYKGTVGKFNLSPSN